MRVILEWNDKRYVVLHLNETRTGVYPSASWTNGIPDVHTSYHADGAFHFGKLRKSYMFPRQYKPAISQVDPYIQIESRTIPFVGLASHIKTSQSAFQSTDVLIKASDEASSLMISLFIVKKLKIEEFKYSMLKTHNAEINTVDLTNFKEHVVSIMTSQNV